MVTYRRQNSYFLSREAEYRRWRDARLDAYPKDISELLVNIGSLTGISDAEATAVLETCKRANMAIYRCRNPFADRQAVRTFASALGLQRLDHHLCSNADGVSELSVATSGVRTEYVPYSNRSLSWHTDGYYNDKSRQVNAVVLHCVNKAVSGGENALLDPEIAYIRLRDEDPRFIAAFEHPQCLTIPANTGSEGEIRAAVGGPVFSYDVGGKIHMRYSARRTNILWRDDDLTRAAREFLSGILDGDNTLVFRYTLQPGEGLVSNNVLHNRTLFTDAATQGRLLYRARYFDRIGAF